MPEFDGLKLCFRDNGLAGFHDIRRIEINRREDKLQLGRIGLVGNGGNSGFQALNLAVQFGAKRILLIGLDMSLSGGVHWYGPNKWPNANNPNDSNFKRWIDAFEGSAALLKSMGVEIINCSMNSAIQCFPKRSLEDAIPA
ncbi:hypothetical protein LB553_01075 [Mesorhizobium sp. CA8]|uniref:hypothetical protein n=1 Tax=Mesorhizobium sp. CA8 TaxID=2876637 RepID=UPI001CCA46B6|nr:hypothetical protein [Mesorhizobium sp. CA8]MBZ9759480.1 hypothetical protein [Mesorhizobium sp. CA8]